MAACAFPARYGNSAQARRGVAPGFVRPVCTRPRTGGSRIDELVLVAAAAGSEDEWREFERGAHHRAESGQPCSRAFKTSQLDADAFGARGAGSKQTQEHAFDRCLCVLPISSWERRRQPSIARLFAKELAAEPVPCESCPVRTPRVFPLQSTAVAPRGGCPDDERRPYRLACSHLIGASVSLMMPPVRSSNSLKRPRRLSRLRDVHNQRVSLDVVELSELSSYSIFDLRIAIADCRLRIWEEASCRLPPKSAIGNWQSAITCSFLDHCARSRSASRFFSVSRLS